MAEERHESGVWDVLVVGSGFGGSVVACRAAQCGKRVLVLERGKWYRPGEFPRTPLQMADNLWNPKSERYGLFQLWSFRWMDAVVASGVGGGSLIYANVAMRMPAEWFCQQRDLWPLDYAELDEHYRAAEKMLGVQQFPAHLDERVPKIGRFDDAACGAGLRVEPAPLAVSFSAPDRPLGDDIDDGGNVHGVRRRTCRLCGECDLGCNEGAKNTLDLTYLSAATSPQLRVPATVRDLSDVRRITPVERGERIEYEVGYFHHDPVTGDRTCRTERARKVVLAAGALGTTWLLLRNSCPENLDRLSDRLGSGFSGNGDALGFLDADDDRTVDSSKGPVITRIAHADGHLVEDGGHPLFAAWMATALEPRVYWRAVRLVVAHVAKRLVGRPDTDVSDEVAEVLEAAEKARSTMPVLVMGMDTTSVGSMRLDRRRRLEMDWPQLDARRYLRRVWRTVDRLARAGRWRLRRGPSDWLSRGITAHPLGGAPMGRTVEEGVVDPFGRVFGHPGLYVADGSVVPGPIGANPSLTIAALAERFATKIVED
ncbi:GMC oxidoreductase [Pseudonocardia lacus]|uniref:GMC oxidoreductase n=1 Tax=Pseudonocardia lacus TaxID=2835865 RepID=UPI001BDCC2F9|nr:GMC family oxidoreductase [Pseudonocardia lacus]